jgi:pyrroline-5-carboxylate reductase
MCGRSVNAPPLAPVLLLGAGKMGSAMFAGWAANGLPPSVLVDPGQPAGIARPQDKMVPSLDLVPASFQPGAVVLAIKPQMAAAILPALATRLPQSAVIVSILAGLTVERLSTLLGHTNPVVRAMPNTPAAIGQGMTVAIAGPGVTSAQLQLCDALLQASGELAWLHDEALIDPITSVSGCGPAYVFLLAELLEQSGLALGIPPALARQLARQTVAGAGALLAASEEDSAQLRRNVTSPNGVTERALAVLMAPQAWPAAIQAALAAATARSRELAG